jgi:hypothetical protein
MEIILRQSLLKRGIDPVLTRGAFNRSPWSKCECPAACGSGALGNYSTLLRLSGFVFPAARRSRLLIFITRLLFAGLRVLVIIPAAALVVLVVGHERIPYLDLQKRLATAVAAILRG